MKKELIILAVSVTTLLVSIQPSLADFKVVYTPNDDVLQTMSYSQARKIIESMENRQDESEDAWVVKNIKISSDKVTWNDLGISYFKSMKIRVDGWDSSRDRYKTRYDGMFEVRLGNREPKNYFANRFFMLKNKDESVSLANAFYVLKRYAEGYGLPDSAANAAFANEAKRYREMPVKPALPEEVQRCRVVAEDAFKNKDFEKAVMYYEKGLAIEPLWPQGQYNAAMLAGELQSYNWAALHMKRYLELVPDAANAKAAREKMYLWEEKAKEEMK
jgi:tetratricopeptide (TPR) repeat protein